MKASSTVVFSSVLLGILNVESFQIPAPTRAPCVKFADAITRTHEVKVPILRGKAGDDDGDGGAKSETKKGKRASVMAFLRRKGAVGRNQDFSTAMGVDEGPVGKNKSVVKKLQKSKESYKWCTDTGIIDDMSEAFPLTSSGSQWRGFTDQVMGGISIGKLIRESIKGRTCNVMKGNVSLYNNGGFIQMATDLSKDPASSLTVDATKFKGVELDVFYQGVEDSENFNVHLRNNSCERQNSSYRGTFEAKQGVWCTVRLPFTDFTGHGPGCVDVPFDLTTLRRMGIVAIGKKMEVYLGIGRVAFY